MTKKQKLANKYLALRKKFDGDDFNPGLTYNQVWYLVKEFKVNELELKIESVKRAIDEKELRLKREAYYDTPEGNAYKANIELEIDNCQKDYKKIHDEFEDWIVTEVNKMVPGEWGARLSIGHKSGNISIGLINHDPYKDAKFVFGHNFMIYFDAYSFGKRSPRFDLNCGTLGSFDLFNDETRPLYLNGLATISNNKEWLQLLMAKFIEIVHKANENSKHIDELEAKLKNPFENK